MPSKGLLDLRNGYNIGKLVSLDYNQKKNDGYLVAIPCQGYTINGETYTAIGTVVSTHLKIIGLLYLVNNSSHIAFPVFRDIAVHPVQNELYKN